MAKYDLENQLDVVASINPAAYNSTQNGATVDLAGYSQAMVVVAAGTRTDGTSTPKVQEGNASDGSDATDVAAADLVGTALVAITSNLIQKIAYIGSKRYIRVVTTVAGATTGVVYGAHVVRSGARKQPL
jgi:hypothetical protein